MLPASQAHPLPKPRPRQTQAHLGRTVGWGPVGEERALGGGWSHTVGRVQTQSRGTDRRTERPLLTIICQP